MDSWSYCAADNLATHTHSVDKALDRALRSRKHALRSISRIRDSVGTSEICIERWMEVCYIILLGMGVDGRCSVAQISNPTV